MKTILGILNGIIIALSMSATWAQEGLGAQEGVDIKAGEAVFRKCKACHMVGANAKNRVGPILNGVVNRPAGSVADYRYSKALADSNLVWDEATLKAYLANPRQFLKGNKMAFVGLKAEQDIINLIGYLKQFDEEGNIMPCCPPPDESTTTE